MVEVFWPLLTFPGGRHVAPGRERCGEAAGLRGVEQTSVPSADDVDSGGGGWTGGREWREEGRGSDLGFTKATYFRNLSKTDTPTYSARACATVFFFFFFCLL